MFADAIQPSISGEYNNMCNKRLLYHHPCSSAGAPLPSYGHRQYPAIWSPNAEIKDRSLICRERLRLHDLGEAPGTGYMLHCMARRPSQAPTPINCYCIDTIPPNSERKRKMEIFFKANAGAMPRPTLHEIRLLNASKKKRQCLCVGVVKLRIKNLEKRKSSVPRTPKRAMRRMSESERGTDPLSEKADKISPNERQTTEPISLKQLLFHLYLSSQG
ncbi:hypothetical protein MGYG_07505 [Nannizzia gypsea CBS 118893]|uniref:Uncharacterized protein n=1 Tax=Arthroderma gypseum (strain ATCC MYA-4604 / CBS 118893) TaxID=535722 RepID=E4V3C3_ARTGP|nr:hypothetical protein MGYG_07505 [Nannizzia gypsea CBS 118893]EFR04497.1 hypothetical protein MGYG_07505 [Nannizzia gypsea CBS 118893]